MRHKVAVVLAVLLAASCASQVETGSDQSDGAADDHARRLIEEGRRTFRFDTFGSEVFWSKTRLHEAIARVSPNQALKLGLKVDVAAVPKAIVPLIRAGTANLDDPAVTAALLKANAVVGVTGFFDESGRRLTAIGIQCSLCHSTVDDSLKPGIGRRLDGWPNRDLDIGAIIASAPDLSAFAQLLQVDEAAVRKVLTGWGPGRYDAQLTLDGKGRPTLIPPAFGLAGVNNHTWTGGWGGVSYWNAYVAVTQMHGQGTFSDPRLKDSERFPVAARTGAAATRANPHDRVTPKLPGLQVYQLSLPTPRPPQDSFDAAAARRGEALFNGKARCASCHVPPLYTEPGWNLHTAEEIGIDDFQAKRSPDGRYRTEPLRALWETKKIHKGGYYHDGRFATLTDVVEHYDRHFGTRMSLQEKADLTEFLKSL